MKLLSCVRLFVTPWTIAYQAPLSMGFSKQGYWSGLPCPLLGDLPDPGMEPRSPTLQADALPSKPPGKHQPFTQIGKVWVNPDLSFPLPFCSTLMASARNPVDNPLLYLSFISFPSGWLAPSFLWLMPLSWCHESSHLRPLCRFLIARTLPHLAFSAACQQHLWPTESPCSPAARSRPSAVWL